MEPKTLLHADYLDIIFDNRNKSYGGYELRRHYNRRLIKGTLLMLLSVVGLSSFSFIRSDKPGDVRPNTARCTLTIFDRIPPPPKPPLVVKPEQLPPAPKPVATQVFTVPKITDDPITPDKQMTEARNITAMPGLSNTGGDSADIAPVITKTGTGIEKPVATISKPPVWVEQMPVFDGLESYLGKHLQYPDAARENGIQGRVIISFVVNEDGAVSDAAVVHGIGGGCDEVALRMVSGMPKWKPGKQNGIPVKVLFTLPIKFALN